MSRWSCILLAAVLAGCEAAAPLPEPGADDARQGATAARVEPAAVPPFSIARPDVVVLLTGSTHGRLEVCNCPGPMAGGLSRRSGLAISYRAAFGTVFLADTGNAFWVEPADPRNRYVLRGYRALGYDAVVLGSHEWAALPCGLAGHLRAVPISYLASNAAARDVRLPTAAAAVRDYGCVKLAAISYLGPETLQFLGAGVRAKLALGGVEAVAALADRLKADGCVVVLLAHVAESELASLGEIKSVDLIVRGYTTHSEETLLAAGNTPVVQVGGPEYVAAVALKVEKARVRKIDYRLEVVDARWPLDQRLMSMYQAYAHQAARGALDAERKLPLAHVPSERCGRCHRKEFEAWGKGPHRQAWATLVRAGRSENPDCLACHTSGFGEAGGFQTPRTTPGLASVNCQVCHRHNLDAHARDIGAGLRPAPAGNATCAMCHTPMTSPHFEFEDSRRRLGCVRARAGEHGK